MESLRLHRDDDDVVGDVQPVGVLEDLPAPAAFSENRFILSATIPPSALDLEPALDWRDGLNVGDVGPAWEADTGSSGSELARRKAASVSLPTRLTSQSTPEAWETGSPDS